ncbi:MAG: phosphodiester glycosidase family protein [Acidobacteriota bacterium]
MAPVRNLLVPLGVGGALLLLFGLPVGKEHADPGRRLRPGLIYREVPVPHPTAGSGFTLKVLEVDPAAFALRVLDARQDEQPTLTSRQYVERRRALAAINGGFFLESLEPLGLLVCDGKERNPLRKADWGIFMLAGGKPRIIHTKDYAASGEIEQALQVGPRLVVEGQPLKLKPQTARRSAIGIDAAGHVHVIVSIEGEPEAQGFADALASPVAKGGLGLAFALNLDGGPSTQLYAKIDDFEVDVPGGWAVPDAIGIFEREGASGAPLAGASPTPVR